ncbi:MAG TPA: hypothetical protein VK061_03225 [Bacillota bacterium]|nr:hypothetical protein [Bacillota bacterium]
MSDDEKTIHVPVRIVDFEDVRYKERQLINAMDNIRETENDFAKLFHNLFVVQNEKGMVIDAIREAFLEYESKNVTLYAHMTQERCGEIVRNLNFQVNNKLTVQDMEIVYKEKKTS